MCDSFFTKPALDGILFAHQGVNTSKDLFSQFPLTPRIWTVHPNTPGIESIRLRNGGLGTYAFKLFIEPGRCSVGLFLGFFSPSIEFPPPYSTLSRGEYPWLLLRPGSSDPELHEGLGRPFLPTLEGPKLDTAFFSLPLKNFVLSRRKIGTCLPLFQDKDDYDGFPSHYFCRPALFGYPALPTTWEIFFFKVYFFLVNLKRFGPPRHLLSGSTPVSAIFFFRVCRVVFFFFFLMTNFPPGFRYPQYGRRCLHPHPKRLDWSEPLGPYQTIPTSRLPWQPDLNTLEIAISVHNTKWFSLQGDYSISRNGDSVLHLLSFSLPFQKGFVFWRSESTVSPPPPTPLRTWY